MSSSKDFELFTQRIVQILANNKVLKSTNVQHNIKLKGKSGCEHQIDVFWEYEKEGHLHRVAIECKHHNRRLSIGRVRDFYGVICDLDGVQGVMVSSKGYQKGAKRYADHYGISLKGLRRPQWNESIGTITTTVYTNSRRCLFQIDEGWLVEHNFDLDKLREFHASIQFDKSDYWRSAKHFPITTQDSFIRDSQGNIVSNLDWLGLMFQKEQEPGTKFLFPFVDGWIESCYWGPVKIREVMFEYANKVQETTLNLAAEDFVDAILEDALSGKAEYIAKQEPFV